MTTSQLLAPVIGPTAPHKTGGSRGNPVWFRAGHWRPSKPMPDAAIVQEIRDYAAARAMLDAKRNWLTAQTLVQLAVRKYGDVWYWRIEFTVAGRN